MSYAQKVSKGGVFTVVSLYLWSARFSIILTLLLVSFDCFAQKVGLDSLLIPREASGEIDFGEVYNRMYAWSREARGVEEEVLQKCNSITEFVSLATEEQANNRDAERFRLEAAQAFRQSLGLKQGYLTYADSILTLFTLVVDESLTKTGTYPAKTKARKAKAIYHETKSRADTVENRVSQIQNELVRIRLWSALPLDEFVRSGDTSMIRDFFTSALENKKELPEGLEPLTVSTISGGAMEISTGFYRAQAEFNLKHPALEDVDYLVTELANQLELLQQKGVGMINIRLAAFLRDREEDLSFITEAANYDKEFGEEALILTYRFLNPSDNQLPERRTLKIAEGPLGFIPATALKLEGLRRAFADSGLDRGTTIEMEIYAPVEQSGPERYEIRIVVK